MQSYLKNFSDKFVQMQFDLRVNVAHGDLFEFDKFEKSKAGVINLDVDFNIPK